MVVVVRRELDRRRAVDRGPDRRIGLLERLGLRQRLVELEELALERDLVLGPRHLDDLHHLRRDRRALIEIDAPADELVLVDADAGAELDPPVRQMVEHRHLLREPQRMVERQLPHHRADPQRRRRARDGGEIDGGRRDAPDRRILMLDDEIRVIAQRLDLLRQADMLVIDVGHHLGFFRVAADRIPQGEIEPGHRLIPAAISPAPLYAAPPRATTPGRDCVAALAMTKSGKNKGDELYAFL